MTSGSHIRWRHAAARSSDTLLDTERGPDRPESTTASSSHGVFYGVEGRVSPQSESMAEHLYVVLGLAVAGGGQDLFVQERPTGAAVVAELSSTLVDVRLVPEG